MTGVILKSVEFNFTKTQSAGDIFHFVNIRGIATKLGEVVPV